MHLRYLVIPSIPGLFVSLADTKSLRGAEGEPVAPLDYLCRSTTDEDEQSGSKTGKDKKKGISVDWEIRSLEEEIISFDPCICLCFFILA